MTVEFEDLSEPGDRIYVAFRNPQTVPFDALKPKDVAYDANGNAIDQDQWQRAMYDVFAGLIVNWRVYDATTESDAQPLLDSPATGELFAKLPLNIQNKISDEVNRLRNPTPTPATTTS